MASSDLGWLAIVGGAFLVFHRGPLIHTIVGYPTGRVTGRVGFALVSAAYVYALAIPLIGDQMATILIATTLVASTAWTYYRSTGPQRQARRIAVAAAAVLALPLLTGSIGRLAGAGPDLEEALIWLYPAAVAAVGIMLTADMWRGRWADAEVIRLVVDLGDPPRAGIRGRLAEALADPSLELAYWLPESGGYVDEFGQPIHVPSAGSERAVTVLERQGERVGALVHDPAAIDDPKLLQAVAAAAQLALANVRLQADVRRHLHDLEASRRRLVDATDDQGRRLQVLIEQGVGRQLRELRGVLERARTAAGPPDESQDVDALLIEAQHELDEAVNDLERLATGAQPLILAELGVGPALSALTQRTGVAVRMAVPPERHSEAVETAIYFICAEALANAQKHAGARRVDVEVRVEGKSIVVVVADDGVGGADPSTGSGLEGLRERIEASGGRLAIDSPPGHGTRIVAAIPLG